MKVKNVKNGDKITVSKTKNYKWQGKDKELKAGVDTIDNAGYILANAVEAGQGDTELKKWIEDHPHVWKDKV